MTTAIFFQKSKSIQDEFRLIELTTLREVEVSFVLLSSYLLLLFLLFKGEEVGVSNSSRERKEVIVYYS